MHDIYDGYCTYVMINNDFFSCTFRIIVFDPNAVNSLRLSKRRIICHIELIFTNELYAILTVFGTNLTKASVFLTCLDVIRAERLCTRIVMNGNIYIIYICIYVEQCLNNLLVLSCLFFARNKINYN